MPPQTPSSADLAKQFGGTASADLAKQFGGTPAPVPSHEAAPTTGPASPKTWLDEVGDFAKELWTKQPIHPVDMVTGTAQAVSHPVETAKAIGAAQVVPLKAAEEAFKRGDYAEGMRHALLYLVPIIGPQMDTATDQFTHGEPAKGLGGMVGTALQVALPEAARRMPSKVQLLNRPGPNPVQAEAIKYAASRGIPVDAATATQSPWVASAQKVFSDNLGGAGNAERFRATQSEALANTGLAEAARANQAGAGVARTAEQGGQIALDAVKRVVQDQHAKATTAYETLRQLESAAPAQTRSPAPGAPFKSVRLAVDLRPSKAALKPTYDRLMQEREIAGTLNGSKARAAVALDTLMKAPDFESLSVVDAALGDLKSLARGADMPELRSDAQSVAALAVKQLDKAVRDRAAAAGPQAAAALTEGRAATVAKYEAADVLDALAGGTQGEPVRIFNRLTGREDTAVNLLRSVKAQAPKALPEIGRALLDEMMGEATADGGFGHAAALASKWKKLGPATKALLFPDTGHVADLDKFFRLAKMVAENPNPSGTARALSATRLSLALPAWAATKLAYTPMGVKLLTSGLAVKSHTGTVSSALTAQMLKVATQNRAMALNPSLAQAGSEKER